MSDPSCWGTLCAVTAAAFGGGVAPSACWTAPDAPELGCRAEPTGRDDDVPDVASDDKNWERPDDGPQTPTVDMLSNSAKAMPVIPAVGNISVIPTPDDRFPAEIATSH